MKYKSEKNQEIRKEIIEQNNKNDILFRNIVMNLDKDYSGETGYNNKIDKVFHMPQYQESEKFGIMFSSKGGSGWIMDAFRENNLSIQPKGEPFGVVWQQSISPWGGEDKHGDLTNILNGSSEKDFILVTRNPLYKFVSGLWEEMGITYGQSNIFRGSVLVEGRSFHNKRGGLLDESMEFIQDMMKKWILGTIDLQGDVSCAHAALYNESYYNLLTLHNINRKNLKIVNIDSFDGDLEDVFNEYYPNLKIRKPGFGTHRHKHEKLLICLSKLCDENTKIHKFISRTIHRDLYYLNRIKKEFENQFYKK